MVSEFAEVDALPGAKVEFAVGDGDCEADAEEGAFCVGGHVVGAFHCVLLTLASSAVKITCSSRWEFFHRLL